MRNQLCKLLVELAENPKLIFLTGDLGFMALEPLQNKLGERFINAGVAEQNMVSVAAGLTLTGLQAWVYTIAPFCYARAFEQIRNDLCLSSRPVKLIGNGGGYAYGPMGGTHHALEDYGVLSTLSNMKIFIPAFAKDLENIIPHLANLKCPSYLRLGRCELPSNFVLPDYHPWRCLLKGGGPLLACVGPLVGPLLNFFRQQNFDVRPEIWVVSELPLSIDSIPDIFFERLNHSNLLGIIEEHMAHGGFGESFIALLKKRDIRLPKIFHGYAKGYPSHTYGSQSFHRAESGLTAEDIIKMMGITVHDVIEY